MSTSSGSTRARTERKGRRPGWRSDRPSGRGAELVQLQISGYFDELEVGTSTGVSRGRTITETDVVTFMMITGNWAEIHSNTEFAATTPYGQRLVQGTLGLSVSQGLFNTGSAVGGLAGLR